LEISAPARRITSRSALRFTRLLPFLPFGDKGMRGTRVSMLAALILANWSTAGVVMGGSGFPTPFDDNSDRQNIIVEGICFRHGNKGLAGRLYVPKKSGRHLAGVMVLGWAPRA